MFDTLFSFVARLGRSINSVAWLIRFIAFHRHTAGMLHVLTDKVNNTTTSTTPRAHPGQDENDDALSNYFDDASTCYDDVSTAKRFATLAIDDDLDPQRFLIAQLDHNQYYALQEADG